MKKLQFKLLDVSAPPANSPLKPLSPVSIRTAKNSDIAKIVTLRVSVFYPEVRALAQFHNNIMAKLLKRIRERGSIILIADRGDSSLTGGTGDTDSDAELFGNDILGSVELSPDDFANTAMEFEASSRKLYIADLAVCPTVRRQGIAKDILKAVEVHAASHGFDELFLHVEREKYVSIYCCIKLLLLLLLFSLAM